MANRIVHRSVALLAVLGLAAVPALGQQRDAAIAGEGELYQVQEGAYGDLFPQQGLGDAASSALALDVTYPDQSKERLLVPGTESTDVDSNPSILFESQSRTLYVLWKSQHNYIHSLLNVIGYHDGEWTDPVEISGSPFGWKSDPEFAVTRDTFQAEEDDGSLRSWTRTVIHLLWWEEGANGEAVPYYSPVTLIDGKYVGWNSVYRLDDLLASALGSAAPAPLNPAVARAQRIEAGSNAQSATLGFVSPSTGELVSVTLGLLPGEVTSISDKIRAQIDVLGRMSTSRPVIADKVRAQIDVLGSKLGLHPGLTDYLAEKIHEEILAASPTEPGAHLADRVRAQIDVLGARMTGGHLIERSSGDPALLVVDLPADEAGVSAPPSQVGVLVTAVRPAPATGSDDVSLHLSRNGREALVSWLNDGVVYYRESQGAGWSAPHPLRLGPNLDLARAQQILDQRADERGVE